MGYVVEKLSFSCAVSSMGGVGGGMLVGMR